MSKHIDYKTYDIVGSLLQKEKTQKTSSNVVVVDIDEKSLKSFGQWPWPRILLAQVLHKVNSYHPSSIGFDIIFSEKDRTSPKEIAAFYKKHFRVEDIFQTLPPALRDNDRIFADALNRTSAVTGLYLNNHNHSQQVFEDFNTLKLDLDTLDIESFKYILSNTPALHISKNYQGFVNTFIDKDSVLRRMPLFKNHNGKLIPTFSLANLLNIDPSMRQVGSQEFEVLNKHVVTDNQTNVLLNFYEDKWYKKVSVVDLLAGKIPSNMLTGKIVLIGSSATSLHDQIIVTGGKKIMGVKVHMTMIDNILNEESIIQKSYFKDINIVLSLVLSFLLLYLLIARHKKSILVLFLFTLSSILIVTSLAFNAYYYLSISYLLVPFGVLFFILSLFYIIIDTYDKYLFKQELTRKHIEELDAKVVERTRELAESKAKLEISHKNIKDSIKYASLIQTAILPHEELLENYMQEFFSFWQPRDTVGGDIYFISELDSKEEVLIMVIDGAGHGVPGAFVTMLVKAIERQIMSDIASKKIDPSPALLLEYFNKSIKTMLEQEHDSKSNAGFDGGILYYNKRTNVCKYAGAKTPLYIVHNNELKVIKGDRYNVGFSRTKIDQTYNNFDVKIEKGMQLYIITDGLPDQEGKNNKRYSKQKFKDLIVNIEKKSLKKQKKDIINSFEDFKSDFVQSDDITVIGLKF